jgi:hypothetical protein
LSSGPTACCITEFNFLILAVPKKLFRTALSVSLTGSVAPDGFLRLKALTEKRDMMAEGEVGERGEKGDSGDRGDC